MNSRKPQNTSSTPTSNSKSGQGIDPGRRLRGMKTVEEALRIEDFPMSKADIEYSVGEFEVEGAEGGYILVHQLTEKFRREQFNSADEVIRALEAARNALKKPAA